MQRSSASMNHGYALAWITLVLVTLAGCDRGAETLPDKRPRPVSTRLLTKALPPSAALVSATVASWKTEDVGFEATGRVEYIVEPNTEIEGRIVDEDGNELLAGTPIGRLESERYQLQVQRAEADVTQATQNLKAARTELEESIPAQIAAAEASRSLAKIEFERSKRLFERNAGAKGDVDRDRANYENAISQLKQLEAARSAQRAQLAVMQSALSQAKQNLRDAQRDLEDCTLYSSFRGQIASVAVVPGSVVSAGQPVATLQMMDPIKVEIEVSAEQSRQLRPTELLPVMVTQPDGSVDTREGYLYLIDTVADTLTRTFTVTLLVMNEKIVADRNSDVTATTDQTWRLDFKFLPGSEEGMLFVGEKVLLQDDAGYYVWVLTDLTTESTMPRDGRLKVRRMNVALGPLKVPYLGNWVFQQIFVDDPQFDPAKNMVVGQLFPVSGQANEWQGDTILLDTGGQWMMRPGDLVKVDLSRGEATQGYFVPMDAIARVDGKSHIFVIEESAAGTVVKRVAVAMEDDSKSLGVSSLRRIAPLTEGDTFEGVTYVTRGAHYLIDGERVNAIPETITR